MSLSLFWIIFTSINANVPITIIAINIIIVICFIIGCVKYDFIPTKINSACTLMLIYDLGNEAYIHRSKIKFNNYILTIIAFISLIILNNY